MDVYIGRGGIEVVNNLCQKCRSTTALMQGTTIKKVAMGESIRNKTVELTVILLVSRLE